MSGFHWAIRWPDGTEEELFSPSPVVAEMFEAGASYPLAEFLQRARVAFERAWDEAERRQGGRSAIEQLERLEARAMVFAQRPGARVHCLRLEV